MGRGRLRVRPRRLLEFGDVLTPVAAVCLVVIMAGAVKTHIDLQEPAIAPAVLGLMCVFVALGRFGAL